MGINKEYRFRVKFGMKWRRMTNKQIKRAEAKLGYKLEVTA